MQEATETRYELGESDVALRIIDVLEREARRLEPSGRRAEDGLRKKIFGLRIALGDTFIPPEAEVPESIYEWVLSAILERLKPEISYILEKRERDIEDIKRAVSEARMRGLTWEEVAEASLRHILTAGNIGWVAIIAYMRLIEELAGRPGEGLFTRLAVHFERLRGNWENENWDRLNELEFYVRSVRRACLEEASIALELISEAKRGVIGGENIAELIQEIYDYSEKIEKALDRPIVVLKLLLLGRKFTLRPSKEFARCLKELKKAYPLPGDDDEQENLAKRIVQGLKKVQRRLGLIQREEDSIQEDHVMGLIRFALLIESLQRLVVFAAAVPGSVIPASISGTMLAGSLIASVCTAATKWVFDIENILFPKVSSVRIQSVERKAQNYVLAIQSLAAQATLRVMQLLEEALICEEGWQIDDNKTVSIEIFQGTSIVFLLRRQRADAGINYEIRATMSGRSSSFEWRFTRNRDDGDREVDRRNVGLAISIDSAYGLGMACALSDDPVLRAELERRKGEIYGPGGRLRATLGYRDGCKLRGQLKRFANMLPGVRDLPYLDSGEIEMLRQIISNPDQLIIALINYLILSDQPRQMARAAFLMMIPESTLKMFFPRPFPNLGGLDLKGFSSEKKRKLSEAIRGIQYYLDWVNRSYLARGARAGFLVQLFRNIMVLEGLRGVVYTVPKSDIYSLDGRYRVSFSISELLKAFRNDVNALCEAFTQDLADIRFQRIGDDGKTFSYLELLQSM